MYIFMNIILVVLISATNMIKSYIKQSNYSTASDIVINNMNGKVKHRKIVFRVNKNKKYFEYQLLYSADIR